MRCCCCCFPCCGLLYARGPGMLASLILLTAISFLPSLFLNCSMTLGKQTTTAAAATQSSRGFVSCWIFVVVFFLLFVPYLLVVLRCGTRVCGGGSTWWPEKINIFFRFLPAVMWISLASIQLQLAAFTFTQRWIHSNINTYVQICACFVMRIGWFEIKQGNVFDLLGVLKLILVRIFLILFCIKNILLGFLKYHISFPWSMSLNSLMKLRR